MKRWRAWKTAATSAEAPDLPPTRRPCSCSPAIDRPRVGPLAYWSKMAPHLAHLPESLMQFLQSTRPSADEHASLLDDLGPLPIEGKAWPTWVKVLVW